MTHHSILQDSYTCEVSGSFIIQRKDEQIVSVTGDHLPGKRNDDVIAFKADAARIAFFPLGLDKIFKNLQSIVINYSRLREIRQIDLKPFKQLKYLDLFDNKIEKLEADLFKYNRDLEVIWLSNNNIRVVDWTAFDGLKKLTSLYLGDNVCISKSAESILEVKNLF